MSGHTTAYVVIAVLWPATVFFAWAQTRRHYTLQLDSVTHRLHLLHENYQAALDRHQRATTTLWNLRAEAATIERQRDARPPASPLAEHLAMHGPATLGELTEQFGPNTALKLIRLADRQEVTLRNGYWEWIPPHRRLRTVQDDPTETVRPPEGVWLPPPPARLRAQLEAVG